MSDPSITTDQDLHFVVQASDDSSLVKIGWTVTGVITKDSLIEFTVTTPSFYQQFTITEELTTGSLAIVATAVDASGNEAVPDSAMVAVIAQ